MPYPDQDAEDAQIEAPPNIGTATAGDSTYGYAYASPGHLPGEPAIPLPQGPPDPSAGPANQPYQMPSGAWALRTTQDHHDRLQALDQQARSARVARDNAARDAQMLDMMMRVAKSTKDIEIAKRSIDVMGLQNDIQNGVPIHQAVARHPMALGSGFGSTLKAVTPVPKFTPTSTTVDGTKMVETSPNRFQQVREPSSSTEMPVDAKLEVAKDPETGKRLGLFAKSGPRTQRLVLDASDKKVSSGDKIRIYSAIQRGILQQLNSVEAMVALKSSAHPKHAYYVGQQEKLAGIQADLESLGNASGSSDIEPPDATNAPVKNQAGKRFRYDPTKGLIPVK